MWVTSGPSFPFDTDKMTQDKSTLEAKIKELETQRDQHVQTQAGLSNQLQDAKNTIDRLEKDALVRHDSGVKVDSPQQEEAPNSITYNINNM